MLTRASAPRAGAAGVRGRLLAALRRGLTVWRRSIQVRVVASTVLLALVLVGIVGWLLLQQVRDGLVDERVERVVAEAARETADARDRLASAAGTDVDASGQQQDLIDPIIGRGAVRGYAVVLSPPLGSGSTLATGGAKFTQNLDLSSVPLSLEQQFAEPRTTSWTYTRIRTTGEVPGLEPGPGIAVASQVTLPADGEAYTVYFLFPLSEQEETLALVNRSLLTAAVLLLLLVAGLAWLVTRQVVTPIRMARRVAERLAAGQLQERMRVRGEDDLARLATSFNQMASNLQRQIRQLEELSRVQRRFVGDVSHELRTPLTTVRMAGDVLHDGRSRFDPATARAAELLQKELDRFETLLADLLEISRFDAGAAVLDVDDVNLADVARRVVDMTAGLAERRRTHVEVIAPEGPCLAEADVRRVERVVRNLVVNAIDHAEGRDIEIRVAADEDTAAISVRDHGVGLAPGEAALVFNRFWRADPARARSTGGTGLGLSISLEDAHLHGGWLQAWGRSGEGALFRLTLPRFLGHPLDHSPLPLVPAELTEESR